MARKQARSVEWWFRDRYRLAPTDPRFLDMTVEGMVMDYWTAHYASLPPSSFEADDPEFDADKVIAELGDDWEDIPHLSTSP
jgi:hypothetical protein